jgi:hypothetical protein
VAIPAGFEPATHGVEIRNRSNYFKGLVAPCTIGVPFDVSRKPQTSCNPYSNAGLCARRQARGQEKPRHAWPDRRARIYTFGVPRRRPAASQIRRQSTQSRARLKGLHLPRPFTANGGCWREAAVNERALRPFVLLPNTSLALTTANSPSLSAIASKFVKFCWVLLPGMVTWGKI